MTGLHDVSPQQSPHLLQTHRLVESLTSSPVPALLKWSFHPKNVCGHFHLSEYRLNSGLDYLCPMSWTASSGVLPPYFSKELVAELEAHALWREAPRGGVLLREGEFVAAAPIVLKGRLKVGRNDGEREFLLYYIQPGESCIMSFTSVLQSTSSRVAAVAEEDTEVLLMPAQYLRTWYSRFPELQRYFLDLYQQRYAGLITAIDLLAFQHLDGRVLAYLEQKVQTLGTRTVAVTHLQIAQDLGAAREAISRVLKKLESEGRLRLGRGVIMLV